jgi:hypothetical protein
MNFFDLPNDIQYMIFRLLNKKKSNKEIWWWYLNIKLINKKMLILCNNLSYTLD